MWQASFKLVDYGFFLQIQELRMGENGAQRYMDQFKSLATKLGWNLQEKAVIYQFKMGLLDVDILMKLVIIEANSHINAREQKLQLEDKRRPFRQEEKGKPFRQEDQRGKLTREPCKFCGLTNHSTEQCYKNPKNALQQQMELFSRMIVAQSENLALFHQKQGSTQCSENAPARNMQDDTDGSEELEYLTPVTLPRFKRVQRKLGYMEDHGLPGREREKGLPKRVVPKYLP